MEKQKRKKKNGRKADTVQIRFYLVIFGLACYLYYNSFQKIKMLKIGCE